MTPNLITRVGTALFGAQFRPQLATALAVRLDTVQRWCADREAVPDGVWVEIIDLLEARELETMNLRHEAGRMLTGKSNL